MIFEKKIPVHFFIKYSNVKIKIREFQQLGFKILHLILFVLEMFCVCGGNGTGIKPQIWS